MDGPLPTPASTWMVTALAVAASGLALFAAASARDAADRARVEAEAASKAVDGAREASAKVLGEIASLRADLDMLATNVDAVQRNIKELADRVDFGGAPGAGGNPFAGSGGQEPAGAFAPPRQPVLEYTPELKESLRKAVAAKGVVLGEDRVSIPGRVVLRQGALEFFAVFPGGKTHESVLVLTGKPSEEGEPAEGLGAALNSCLMALGLKPGTPIHVLPGGKVIPAKGTPVHLAVEWEEEGRTVRVRAEDLMWDRERNRTMEEGKFIYVGSYFVPDGYVPDLSRDAVAVYSVETCVVDLDDPRAANDTVFMACAPRIPEPGTAVRLVFSPGPLPPTRTWDPEDPEKRTDAGAGAEPAPAEGEGSGGK